MEKQGDESVSDSESDVNDNPLSLYKGMPPQYAN